MSSPGPDYHQILVTETAASSVPKERSRAAADIVECVRLRERYVYQRGLPARDDARLQGFQRAVRADPFGVVAPPDGKGGDCGFSFEMDAATGIAVVRQNGGDGPGGQNYMPPPFTLAEFNRDLANVWRVSTGKITRSFAFRRLRMLDVNYEFHTLMNETLELESTRDDLADFESITKVDNHIHAAGGFTRAELLNFIKRKAREDGGRVVTSDGKTLIEALAESGIQDPEDITIDKLDVAATASMFHRFDNFNDSYNPFGAKDLRTIFMKSKNVTGGLYFAELIRDVLIARVQRQGNRVAIEPRLSIYGRGGFKEWKALAKWVLEHKVLDVRQDDSGGDDGDGDDGKLTGHVKWMIQLPRLCNIFMGKSYESFAGLMKNIFEPMFAATLDPDAHPEIYTFLNHVSAIDCVDDESNHDSLLVPGAGRDMPAGEWTDKSNPPYSYWCYHVWANLYTLNRLREARGLNTFTFKPHGGESGPRHHLATCYLLADSVNHGWRLDMEPALQYLYYLSQIGLGLCPLSNDALFIQMKDSPVGKLHKRGLRVCLGTDDPLQFHNTATPLLEEYTVGGHFFEFTGTDKSEIARNSVLTSGFEHHWKKKWLGDSYTRSNLVDANTQDRSNISDIRTSFRHSNLMRELHYVALRANEAGDEAKSSDKSVRAAEEEKDGECIAASGSSTVRFVHLAGHSIPMAESLFRGVNGTAVLAGQIAMRDDVERESESAQDLKRVWKVQKKAVDAVGEAHRRASLNVSKTSVRSGGDDAEDNKDLSLGFGSSATGLAGVTPAQVSKFVSKRHRCSVMQ